MGSPRGFIDMRQTEKLQQKMSVRDPKSKLEHAPWPSMYRHTTIVRWSSRRSVYAIFWFQQKQRRFRVLMRHKCS